MAVVPQAPVRADLRLLSAVLALVVLAATPVLGQEAEVSWTEFLAELRAGHLTEVTVTEWQLRGRLTEEAARDRNGAAGIVAVRLPGLDETLLLNEIAAGQVKVTGRLERIGWGSALAFLLVPLLVILLVFSATRRKTPAGPGGLSFNKTRARLVDQWDHGRVTFNDVAGVDEAEAELVEVVDFLRLPQKYQRLGGRIPKGVLLVGPPGTGKTLLARAVAGEARVPFFSISGSEFVEMFVGVGAARVRDLFEQAKLRAPSIIFIDELDAVGKLRTSARGLILGNDEREQTLNQLLAEMDGFDTSPGIVILAATNTPEALDPALLRAGRFDRQVVVDRPDLQGREAILRVHARGVTLGEDVDLHALAARTPGMAGADLANIVNEAALLAARRVAQAVEKRDLEEAVDRVMLGLEKKSRLMSADEKERVAFHEAGHALVALSLPHASPVHRVSIIPRSVGALGHTLQLPTQERYLLTHPELQDQLAVMLGGRAAEELHYAGVVSTGAADDLERASELARQMVTRFGMSDRLGQLTYGRPLGGRFLGSSLAEERNYSEATARAIDEEALRIVEEAHRRARAILEARLSQLDRVAAELVRRETLQREELEAMLRPALALAGA